MPPISFGMIPLASNTNYLRPLSNTTNLGSNTSNWNDAYISKTLLSDGTATAPSVTFTSDSNTGFYRVAENTIGVTSGGTLMTTFSNGNLSNTGDIYIGGKNYNSDGTEAAPSISFANDTGNNTGFYRVAENTIGVTCGGTLAMTMSNNEVVVNGTIDAYTSNGVGSTNHYFINYGTRSNAVLYTALIAGCSNGGNATANFRLADNRFQTGGADHTSNYIGIGFWGNDDIIKVNTDWTTTLKGNVYVGGSIKSTSNGLVIEKIYNSSSNRYGISQDPGGIIRVYAASAYTPATVRLGFCTDSNAYNDTVTISQSNVNVSTHSNIIMTASNVSISSNLYVGGSTYIPGGTAAAPSICVIPNTFSSDSNTGFYSEVEKIIGVSAGGALRAWFDTSNTNVYGGILLRNSLTHHVASNIIRSLAGDISIAAEAAVNIIADTNSNNADDTSVLVSFRTGGATSATSTELGYIMQDGNMAIVGNSRAAKLYSQNTDSTLSNNSLCQSYSLCLNNQSLSGNTGEKVGISFISGITSNINNIPGAAIIYERTGASDFRGNLHFRVQNGGTTNPIYNLMSLIGSNQTIEITGPIRASNNDPGALIERAYNTSNERYGISQDNPGITRVYASTKNANSSVRFSFSSNPSATNYVDKMIITLSNIDMTASNVTMNSNLSVGGSVYLGANGSLTWSSPNLDYAIPGAGSHVFKRGGSNLLLINGTAIFPQNDTAISCGASGNRFSAVYAFNGTIQTSDENEKISTPLLYGLSNVVQIDTIKFKWKTQESLPDDDPTKSYEYFGVCARQLNNLFPELVYNEQEPYQINYTELIPVIINAIKDLKNENTELRNTIQSLVSRIELLE